jgi:hypothetical protein
VEEKSLDDSIERNEIQLRMEEVRRDLDASVQDTVEGVREMCVWRTYMKAHPWSCLGAALAVGYLIAWWGPFRSKREGETLSEAEKQRRADCSATIATRTRSQSALDKENTRT